MNEMTRQEYIKFVVSASGDELRQYIREHFYMTMINSYEDVLYAAQASDNEVRRIVIELHSVFWELDIGTCRTSWDRLRTPDNGCGRRDMLIDGIGDPGKFKR